MIHSMSYDFTFVCYNNLIGVEKDKRNNELDTNTQEQEYYKFTTFKTLHLPIIKVGQKVQRWATKNQLTTGI